MCCWADAYLGRILCCNIVHCSLRTMTFKKNQTRISYMFDTYKKNMAAKYLLINSENCQLDGKINNFLSLFHSSDCCCLFCYISWKGFKFSIEIWSFHWVSSCISDSTHAVDGRVPYAVKNVTKSSFTFFVLHSFLFAWMLWNMSKIQCANYGLGN